MNMFLYMPRPAGKGDELLSAVGPLVSPGCLEVFPDLQSFGERIRQPKDPFSIALIWNPTQDNLREIGRMRDFLARARTLLVLPDQERETIALAHKIFPTYISYIDDGISEIVAVLKQLIKARRNGSCSGAGGR
jgi:hypothetical protein